MSGPILRNSLADLAERARAASVCADDARRTAHEKMIECGALLVEAKAACRHGEWSAFLARAGIHERKARRYMQLARAGLESDTVTGLGGLKAALKVIAFFDEVFADIIERGSEPPTHEDAARWLIAGRKLRALERREPGAIRRILDGILEHGAEPTPEAMAGAVDAALVAEASA